jgi:hypothetical protein
VDDWKYTFIQQPQGWLGPIVRPNLLTLVNLRQDPYERMNWAADLAKRGSIAYWDSFKHEMWRFQVASQVIVANISSIVEFPPMQVGAGFSTGDLKEKVEAVIAASKANGD